jgi:hypothetical protein
MLGQDKDLSLDLVEQFLLLRREVPQTLCRVKRGAMR